MANEPDTHYTTLNISKYAEKPEVEKAYRNLVKTWHPDKCADKAVGQQKLIQVNKAYETLGNEKNKKEYDAYLRKQEKIAIEEAEEEKRLKLLRSDSESSMNMHKFKKQLRELNAEMEKNDPNWEKINTDFNSSPDNPNRRRNPILDTPYKRMFCDIVTGVVEKTIGEDLFFDMYLSLEDLHQAKVKKITLKRRTSPYNYENYVITLPIRRNMYDGEVIKMDKYGHYIDKYGLLTREPGDCIIYVHVMAHDVFSRVGINLHASFLISLKDAKDGFEREVTDLDGVSHIIKVNKLERSDYVYVIRSKGMKKFDAHRGDIIVNFAVVLTEETTKNKKSIYKITPNPMNKTKPNKKKIIQPNVVNDIPPIDKNKR
jgi:DnaJ-class molecular chaperone